MKRVEFITEVHPKYIKIFDGDFNYSTFSGVGLCHLRVYRSGLRIWAIAKEHELNKAASITNASESLWQSVTNIFGKGRFYETYDDLKFDSIEIINGKSMWLPCNDEITEMLRGLK